MGGGAKLHLKTNPTSTRDTWRAENNLCSPGDLTETVLDLPLSVSVSPAEAEVSSGLLWGQGLWLQQTREVHHVSPTIEPLSRQPTTGEQLYQRSSCTVVKVLGLTFPNLGIQQRE